jgi:hypothetical protein
MAFVPNGLLGPTTISNAVNDSFQPNGLLGAKSTISDYKVVIAELLKDSAFYIPPALKRVENTSATFSAALASHDESDSQAQTGQFAS